MAIIMKYDKPTALRIRDFLIKQGLTVEGAYGMMANIYCESGFRSNNAQNSCMTRLGMTDEIYTTKVDRGEYKDFAVDRVGYGLCQWTSAGRKTGLLSYAKEQKKSIADETIQLNYLMKELKTSYKTVLNIVTTSHDISECAKYVMTKFERPANQSEVNQNKRASYGIQLFNDLEEKKVSNKIMGYKVAIDAGHGSNTAGKRTPDGYREHYANVKVASYFVKAMDRCNVSYIKVGWDDDNSKDDPDVSLSARQNTIKNAGCEYSISFHFNAFGDGKSYNSAEGIVTFISDKNSCVGDSKKMADCVQAQLIKGTKQVNRGVKRKALSMCNCSMMGTKASILIECAFMTNKRESELMQSDAFCLECAEETAKGFCQYIGITYVEPNKNTTNTVPSIPTPTVPTTPTSTKKYMFNGLDYSPVFDSTYYADNYADLKKAFGTNATKLFNHFTIHGMKEGRQAISTFNVIAYKNRYVDLQKAFGNNLPSYYKHYIQFGKKEGRSAV